MSRREDAKRLKEIVTAKADFIESLQHGLSLKLGDELESLTRARKRADAMPARGSRQRYAQAKELRRIDDWETRLQANLVGPSFARSALSGSTRGVSRNDFGCFFLEVKCEVHYEMD